MRKKLDTRFPAARIKKIMQADEDVGKIAMAVPLLVSKALELFLQDLCDRTYEITLRRGAKTMNAFHLKQCVQTFNVFDFLKDIVSKVPDLGGSVATGDDHTVTKRRKVADAEDDDNDSDEEPKRNKKPEARHTSGRGRGRGRGRGHGRGIRTVDQEMSSPAKFEDDSHVLKQNDNQTRSNESMENVSEPEEVKQNFPVSKPAKVSIRNFDLNMNPDENMMDSLASPTSVPTSSSAKSMSEEKHEEYPGWSLSDMEKMTIDPMQLANLNGGIDEDEEDYDEEM
ncbi:Dr1-associated corepressor [Spatholobus suberectus]|nr:Dr1-associated corepressor [Spatholobus suberectus]